MNLEWNEHYSDRSDAHTSHLAGPHLGCVQNGILVRKDKNLWCGMCGTSLSCTWDDVATHVALVYHVQTDISPHTCKHQFPQKDGTAQFCIGYFLLCPLVVHSHCALASCE